MVKITLKVDGMMCGMCESHMNDAVRRNLDVSKVSSSHAKGETVIIAKAPIEKEKIEAAVAETGYRVLDYSVEPYEKSGFFSLFKRK